MKFKIMCDKGDAGYTYEEMEMAEIKFNELKGSGMLPMVIGTDSKKRVLQKFDSGVEEVLWLPAIVGG